MASTDEAPQVTGVAEIPAKPDAADDEDLKGTAFWAREIYANLLAALTTSFAAISLGAAFGVLSERGALKGILSAGLIPLIAGLLGGTRVKCGGPTGPMTTVTYDLIDYAKLNEDGLATDRPDVDPDLFVNWTILFAGAMLIIIAPCTGQFVTIVPNVVISGFMNGIACLIWVDQVKVLFGLGGKTQILGPVGTNVIFTVVTFLCCLFLPKIFGKFLPEKVMRVIPWTLVVMGIFSVAAIPTDIELTDLGEKIESFEDIERMVNESWPFDDNFDGDLVSRSLPYAIQLVILCYLDTLLTALVVDKMIAESPRGNIALAGCKCKPERKPNDETVRWRELGAQGLANGVCALVGGLPGAQATIRSVLILKEGASMRLSGTMVGVFTLIEMFLFQDAIGKIPKAVFCGVLFKVGYDVFEWTPCFRYARGIRDGQSDKTLEKAKLEDLYNTAQHKVDDAAVDDADREEALKERNRYARQLVKRGLEGSVRAMENIYSAHVDHVQMFMIFGTTMVTIFLNLNYAVVIFTALYHLLVQTSPKGREKLQCHSMLVLDTVSALDTGAAAPDIEQDVLEDEQDEKVKAP